MIEWSGTIASSNAVIIAPNLVSFPSCLFLPKTLEIVSSLLPKRYPPGLIHARLRRCCNTTLLSWLTQQDISRQYLHIPLPQRMNKLYRNADTNPIGAVITNKTIDISNNTTPTIGWAFFLVVWGLVLDISSRVTR